MRLVSGVASASPSDIRFHPDRSLSDPATTYVNLSSPPALSSTNSPFDREEATDSIPRRMGWRYGRSLPASLTYPARPLDGGTGHVRSRFFRGRGGRTQCRFEFKWTVLNSSMFPPTLQLRLRDRVGVCGLTSVDDSSSTSPLSSEEQTLEVPLPRRQSPRR